MTDLFIQIIGWVGTILVVAAYFLNGQGKLSGKSRTYQLLNLFGALFISVNVFIQQAWPAFGLQIVWGGIAIYELGKISLRNRKN